MPKTTIDFSDYEDREYEEYQGEDPKPGTWLNGVVNRAKYLEEDNQVVMYITTVDHPDYAGWTRGWYFDLDSDSTMKWKAQDIILALTGVKKPVTLDWTSETAVANWLKKAKKIRFKVGEYNDRANIRSVRPLVAAVGTKAAPQAAAAKATKATPAPEPEAPADDELEDYTEEELGELSISELVEILTDEFEVPEDDLPKEPTKPRRDPDGSKMAALEDTYKDELIDAILEEQDEDGKDGDPDQPEGGEGDFNDGFPEDGDDPEPEPEPEPTPAPRTRRTRAAAKPAPEPEPAPAPAARTRRTRR